MSAWIENRVLKFLVWFWNESRKLHFARLPKMEMIYTVMPKILRLIWVYSRRKKDGIFRKKSLSVLSKWRINMLQISMGAHTYAHAWVSLCAHACVWICVDECVHASKWAYTFTHACMLVRAYVCVCVSVNREYLHVSTAHAHVWIYLAASKCLKYLDNNYQSHYLIIDNMTYIKSPSTYAFFFFFRLKTI